VSRDTSVANELDDTAEALERKASEHDLPVGFILLFGGLILWGIWYLWAYSPWSTGWTQAGELQQAAATTESNVFMTILMTALPTLAAVGLYLLQKSRKR
jgi:heme/copper-type cytochrome/quinol oxidase subunit 2